MIQHDSLGRRRAVVAAAAALCMAAIHSQVEVTGRSGHGTVSGVNGGALRLTVDGAARELRPGDHRDQIELMPTGR